MPRTAPRCNIYEPTLSCSLAYLTAYHSLFHEIGNCSCFGGLSDVIFINRYNRILIVFLHNLPLGGGKFRVGGGG
jgi:hypothetical protein